MAEPDHQKLMCLMVTEALADTIRALFGHPGWELTEIQPGDVDMDTTVNKATE